MDEVEPVDPTRSIVPEWPVEGVTAAAFEAFGSELLRFATRRTRDADRAEDIVQEAFLRLATESRAGRDPNNPRGWLYRVILNLIITDARHAVIARREAGHLGRDVVVTDTPEVLYLVSERDRGVGAALDVIRAEGRVSLVLAANGYSGREIATAIGRSEAATRTIMCRARGSIRRAMAAHDEALPG
jgi:RNA polymerase sigma-70 factor, ECF subfamily